jgi:hypothetical protein
MDDCPMMTEEKTKSEATEKTDAYSGDDQWPDRNSSESLEFDKPTETKLNPTTGIQESNWCR